MTRYTAALASRNRGKARELNALLGDSFELLTLDDLGCTSEIPEDGLTFEENARRKAEAVRDMFGMPALADDSGLVVDALGGAPGVFSARFAGRHGDDAANNALLLDLLLDKPQPRTARFVCALAFARPGGNTIIAHGACEGEIGICPDGNRGFGYDPLFYINGVSLARMSAAEKNMISHRAAAVRALIKMLAEGIAPLET